MKKLPGSYRRPLERLDRLHHGTPDGETGPLVRRLQSFGELQTYVVGNWGNEDGDADEGGEEGAVDGLSSWPWLGEKRQMPWSVKKRNKYNPKHNFYLLV